MYTQIIVASLFALVTGGAYAQTSQNNQSPAIEKCVDEKIALFRKHEGDGPLIRFDMLEEWRRDCTAPLAKQKAASSRNAPTNNVQQIQNWSSFTFQEQRFARMVTSSVADTGDTFYLMLDLSPPCSTVNMRLSFQHEKPLTSPVTRNWLILMWPDGVRSIGGHVTYNGKVGDQVAIFTLNEMPKFPELYRRMVSGQFVHTDLGNQDGKILAAMRFSLMGFTDSYKRIDNLCRRM